MNLLLRIILFIILVLLLVKTGQIIHEKYFSSTLYPPKEVVVKTPPKAIKPASRPTHIAKKPHKAPRPIEQPKSSGGCR